MYKTYKNNIPAGANCKHIYQFEPSHECVKLAWDSQLGISILPNHNHYFTILYYYGINRISNSKLQANIIHFSPITVSAFRERHYTVIQSQYTEQGKSVNCACTARMHIPNLCCSHTPNFMHTHYGFIHI